MRKLLKYFLAVAAFTILFASCDSDDFQVPESVYYISNQITPINSYSVNIRYNIADHEVESINGDPVVKFPVRATMPVTQNTVIECGLNEAYLAYYNEKNGTSFEALPQNLYTIEKSTATIEAGQTVSADSIVVRINTDTLPANIEEDITEALPIGIISVNNSTEKISSNMSSMMILWRLDVIYSIINSDNVDFGGTKFNNNVTAWSSQGGTLAYLTDGLTARSWYPYSAGTELEIRLDEEETLKGMIVHTLGGSYQLGGFKASAKMNGTVKEIGEFRTTDQTTVLYVKFTQPLKTDFISITNMITRGGGTMPDITEIYLVK